MPNLVADASVDAPSFTTEVVRQSNNETIVFQEVDLNFCSIASNARWLRVEVPTIMRRADRDRLNEIVKLAYKYNLPNAQEWRTRQRDGHKALWWRIRPRDAQVDSMPQAIDNFVQDIEEMCRVGVNVPSEDGSSNVLAGFGENAQIKISADRIEYFTL